MEQVELLATKGGGVYNAIQQYYKLRNGFAHGQFPQTPIDLRRVAADLARQYAQLRIGR